MDSMKRLFTKRWVRWLAVVVFLAAFGIVFSPQKSFAAADFGNELVLMATECHDMKKTAGDPNTTWGKCELYQAGLHANFGCSNTMFYSIDTHPDPADPSVVKTLWYTDPTKFADCLDKVQAALDTIKADPCHSMAHGGGVTDSPAWIACEKTQNKLDASIGCSNRMFMPLAGVPNHFTQDPAMVAACQTLIDAGVNALLTAPDGTKATAASSAPAPATAGGGGPAGGDTAGTSCAGGAMGWLLCPMINYMAKTVKLVAGLIDGLMTVKFLSSESGGAAIEGIWRTVLSVANIMLVVAFMFIIFSQSTSAGLSNYGIKRMLPRLIIAAILMNLSFYICALAIDLSNIIGGSIMGFLLGSGNSIAASVGAATGDEGGSFLGGAIAGIALVALAFFLFTPILLGILALFVAVVGRQVILLVLVLVSPLAFVAWLLPNTEKYFKKWSELFFQLLIMYPMVMLVFGAALLLSNLIGSQGSTLNLTGG